MTIILLADIWNTFATIGAFCSGIGLLFAGWQIYLSRRDAHKLHSIQESLTTRYISDFPDFLNDIIELLQGATESVHIVCDVPAYALYSAPKRSLRYRNVLQELALDGKPVKIVHLDDKRVTGLHDEQFSCTDEEWTRWKASEVEKGRLRKFCDRYFPSDPEAKELNQDEFRVQLTDQHRRTLEHDFENICTFPVATPISLYFWIADEKKAILSVPSFFENAVEFGFMTEDSRLIRALLHMHRRLMQESTTSCDSGTHGEQDGAIQSATAPKKNARVNSKAAKKHKPQPK